jgi:hypothetical protein
MTGKMLGMSSLAQTISKSAVLRPGRPIDVPAGQLQLRAAVGQELEGQRQGQLGAQSHRVDAAEAGHPACSHRLLQFHLLALDQSNGGPGLLLRLGGLWRGGRVSGRGPLWKGKEGDVPVALIGTELGLAVALLQNVAAAAIRSTRRLAFTLDVFTFSTYDEWRIGPFHGIENAIASVNAFVTSRWTTALNLRSMWSFRVDLIR